MCQCILFAKQAPYVFFIRWMIVVKLMCLHFRKLTNQLLVDDKILMTVLAGGLILMCSYS